MCRADWPEPPPVPSDSPPPAVSTDPKKDFHRVALAALAGFELRRLADGRWLASRWDRARELAEDEVDGWLRQVDGKGA